MIKSVPLILVILLILVSGCATSKLWGWDSKKEYIKIVPSRSDEDVEIALKETGKNYYCKELYASTHPNNKICYMEKEDALALHEKIIATPVALIADVLTPVFVVGYIVLAVELEGGYTYEK